MILKSIHTALIFSLALLLFNCSISKRHYRKGYHIAWHTKSVKEKNELEKDHFAAKKRIEPLVNSNTELLQISNNQLSTSASNDLSELLNESKPKFIKTTNDTCADVIVFRDGSEITAKIVEIYNGTVRYLPCDNLDGPLRVGNAEKIFMIKYANGTKEVFKETPKSNSFESKNNTKPEPIKKINGFALASFIFSMFWFIYFIPAIIAFILGLIALNQIRDNPGVYKNKWMAKFGIMVAIIIGGLLLLAFIGG